MRRLCFLQLFLLSTAQFAFADQDIKGVVVSIYRPLEMESRRVSVERKVFIQSEDEAAFPKGLTGQTLTVFRVHAIPAQIDMKTAGVEIEQSDPKVDNRDAQMLNENAKSLSPLEGGRPSGFSAARNTRETAKPIYLGRGSGSGDTVRALQQTQIQATEFRQEVGRIRVLSVEGDVAMAVVVEDALRDSTRRSPSIQAIEGTTVSAGDRVEGVLRKKRKKKTIKPLSKAETKALKKERERIRKINKPKKKRLKFRRKIMEWDL